VRCLPHDSTSAEWEGAARAIQLALKDARLNQVSYINAHGTSTTANDSTETAAIKKAVGEYAYKVLARQSMTGHLWVACGIEAVATVMAIANDQIHPLSICQILIQSAIWIMFPLLSRSNSRCGTIEFFWFGHNVTLAFKKYV